MLAWVMNLGFSASAVLDAPPDQEGLEFTLRSDRCHHALLKNRAHYTFATNRAHYTVPEDD